LDNKANSGRRHTPPRSRCRPPVSAEDVIGFLRKRGIILTWDQAAVTLQLGNAEAAETITGKAGYGSESESHLKYMIDVALTAEFTLGAGGVR
jgi:hypothetical protein